MYSKQRWYGVSQNGVGRCFARPRINRNDFCQHMLDGLLTANVQSRRPHANRQRLIYVFFLSLSRSNDSTIIPSGELDNNIAD